MNKDEALKLALEALEDLGMKHYESTGEVLYKETFAAIKEALAQPEQEPVALVIDGVLVKSALPEKYTGHLYTAPPQRPWVEPTGNEWFDWWRVSPVANETEAEIDFADFLIIAQAVVAKLKDDNK